MGDREGEPRRDGWQEAAFQSGWGRWESCGLEKVMRFGNSAAVPSSGAGRPNHVDPKSMASSWLAPLPSSPDGSWPSKRRHRGAFVQTGPQWRLLVAGRPDSRSLGLTGLLLTAQCDLGANRSYCTWIGPK